MNISNKKSNRAIIFIMMFVLLFGLIFTQTSNVYASDVLSKGDSVRLVVDKYVYYGSGSGGYTRLMKVYRASEQIDDTIGERHVYCTQPSLSSPSSGTYTIDRVYDKDSGVSGMMRKLVYYSPQYPGASFADSKWYNSNWSTDNKYAVTHLAVSYVAAGYDANMAAWGGGTVKSCTNSTIWNKMIEVVNDCLSDSEVPDPPDSFKCFYIINSGCQNIVGGYDDSQTGDCTLVKKSSNTDITDNNNCYDFAGAEFTVYNSDGDKVGTLTCESDGTSNTLKDLGVGEYTVKETKAPTGYILNDEVKTVTIEEDEVATVEFEDVPYTYNEKGYPLELYKYDEDAGKFREQGNATLKGAQYTVEYYDDYYDDSYYDSSSGKASGKGDKITDTPTRKWVFETDENGYWKYDKSYLVSGDSLYKNDDGEYCLPRGTVKVYESKAPTGYNKDTDVHVLKYDGTNTNYSITVYSEDPVQRAGIKIQKRDAETGDTSAMGGATLEGAVYEITNKSKNAVCIYVDGDENNKKWYDPGEVCYTLTTDKDGKASTPNNVFPYGTYAITEKTPSEGYLIEGTNSKIIGDSGSAPDFSITASDDGKVKDLTAKIASSYDPVKRGDFEFNKVAYGSNEEQKSLAGVAFLLTSKSNGESHVIVTDVNGYWSSSNDWNAHSNNTNKNDEAYNWDTGELDESKLNDEYGTWFGTTANGKTGDVYDALPALPYDTYELKELRSSANEGYDLITKEITIYRDKVTVKGGTISDPGETEVTIGTTATDDMTGTNEGYALGSVTLTDTIAYDGLKIGSTYTIETTVMDKETGDVLKNADGEDITATKEFKAKSTSGTVDVSITIDASDLAGKDIVFFEELYLDEGIIAQHVDLEDEDQTITFIKPEIGTTAIDAESGTHMSFADDAVTVTDAVSYSGLIKGLEYTVTGYLMDKETGEVLKDADGNAVTAEATFTAKEESGTVDVVFHFDGSSLAGTTAVAFEYLELNGEELASHEDIDDEDQTIYFPKLTSTAIDSETKNHTSEAKEEITIIDTVFYSGLTPGIEYEMTATAVDTSTGLALTEDGKNITGSTTFTPESTVTGIDASGTVEVEVTFNASELAEKNIVFYENLTVDGKTVGVHNDISDKQQMILVSDDLGKIDLNDDGTPKTGDDFPWILLLCVIAMAGAITTIVVISKKSKAKRVTDVNDLFDETEDDDPWTYE